MLLFHRLRGRIASTVALLFLLTSCARSSKPPSSRPGVAQAPVPAVQRSSLGVAVGPRQAFAADACIAFPPAGKDRHRTIFIDAGHGGPDAGATGTASDGKQVQEKTLTLAVGLDLSNQLRRDGYRVVLSRTRDGTVGRTLSGSVTEGAYTPDGVRADLRARVACANSAHARLLISIHFDAFWSPAVGGAQTVYDPRRPFSGQSLHFARLIQRAVLLAFQAHGWDVSDRGVIPDTRLDAPTLSVRGAAYGHLVELGPAKRGWLDHPSLMPGALLEPLFLTDPAEASVARSHVGQEALSGAVARAVREYFSAGSR